MELISLYFPMYILFSFLLMIVFQIIGKNGALAFIPIYSMYTALKFLKGRIYYRNWGMFYVIGTILVIPVTYIIVVIITEYHKSQSAQYSSNPWAGFAELMTGIFFMFYIANIYKKLQLENKTIVSEIDYDKYPRPEIKRIIRSRNYNLFEK